MYSALIFSDATMSCCRVGLLMEMGSGGAAGQAGRPVEGAWEPSFSYKVHVQVAGENSKVGHSSQHSRIQPRLRLSPPLPFPAPPFSHAQNQKEYVHTQHKASALELVSLTLEGLKSSPEH